MSHESVPKILIVDDRADTDTSLFETRFEGVADARALHPNDVERDDLRWADVVLVDQRLDCWPERDELDVIGLQPRCGVALAAIYREHVDALEDGGLTAIAVHSAHLDDLAGRLPPGSAAHIIARLSNLEWAFSKTEDSLPDKVASLGRAVRRLPRQWPSSEGDAAKALARELLALEADEDWCSRAWEDVLHCQIPIVDMMGGAHGLLFIRWLLQTILPFPTFLGDELWLAARLRITPASLRQLLERGTSPLASKLAAVSYRGLLEDFDGKRWWKGGVEQLVWQIRSRGARGADELHAALQEMAEQKLERLEATSPAVCVGRDLRPTGVIARLEDTVRLVPDLWPPFADPPLAEIEVVREHPSLQAILHPLDIDAFAEAAGDEED